MRKIVFSFQFLSCLLCLLSCSTQKEVVSDTSLSMERQDSTIVTTAHKETAERFQNLKLEVLDSLDVLMTITEFYPQTDTASGLQMVKSFKDIRINRGRKSEAQQNSLTTEARTDTTAVTASSSWHADYKSNSATKKQVKGGPDWENIILLVIVLAAIAGVLYLVLTAPPYKYDPNDPDQGW